MYEQKENRECKNRKRSAIVRISTKKYKRKKQAYKLIYL